MRNLAVSLGDVLRTIRTGDKVVKSYPLPYGLGIYAATKKS